MIFIITMSFAQVGINIDVPDSSAVLQLESTTRGFLPPRLTSVQRDAIGSPATGLLIFNTDDSLVQYYNGRCWLNAYQKSCDECEFIMSMSSGSGSIDRILSDSLTATIDIRRTTGVGDINLIVVAGLPSGVTAMLDTSTVDSAGTVHLQMYASIFAAAGNYPIIIQGICGDQIRLLVFNLTVEPCINVSLASTVSNYDMQAANGLPGPGTPICAVLNIAPGATIGSGNPSDPAYTNGNLDSRSHIGILNNGNIIGRGGDGAYGGGLTGVPPGNPGNAGGNAMELTTKTTLVNNGYIYGGGSGGSSVGLSFSFPIPVIGGSFTVGFGLGGGGGSTDGAGGAAPGTAVGFFEDGTAATSGVGSTPGTGGSASYPISVSVGVGTLEITPSGNGGNGGSFGQRGGAGYLDVSLAFVVSVPIIGTTRIPIPIPGGLVPLYGPTAGNAGLAVKRNGNILIGLADGSYSTLFIKGDVQP